MTGTLLIGLVAGFVSSVLFASAATGTLLGAFVLSFLSPLPIAVAGLGWGLRAALIAALVASAGAAALAGPVVMAFFILVHGAPCVLLTYLALLSRPAAGPSGTAGVVEWYPVGRLLAAMVALAAGLASIALLTTSASLDGLRRELRRRLEQTISGSDGPTVAAGGQWSAERLDVITELSLWISGPAIAGFWLMVMVVNLYLAAVTAARSGRLARPWPELAGVRLPPAMALATGCAIGGIFLGGYPGLIASGAAGALVLAFQLVGLAILHTLTRGLAARPLILGAAYGSIIALFPFGTLALALIGLAEPISPLRRGAPTQPHNS